MLETFIIDGDRTEVIIQYRSFKAELLEVTTFSDKWRNYIHSGLQFLKIEGKSTDGHEVNGTFQILERKDGILHLRKMVKDWDLRFKAK